MTRLSKFPTLPLPPFDPRRGYSPALQTVEERVRWLAEDWARADSIPDHAARRRAVGDVEALADRAGLLGDLLARLALVPS